MTDTTGNQKQKPVKIFFQDKDISFRKVFDDEYGLKLSDSHSEVLGRIYSEIIDCFDDYYFDKEHLAEEIFDNLEALDDWAWIVYKGEAPKGLIAVDNWYGDKLNPHSCIIHFMFLKEARGLIPFRAARMILNYLINEVGIYRITCTVDVENIAALKFYQKLGFQIEGTHRGRVLLNGIPRDEVTVALIRTDWKP